MTWNILNSGQLVDFISFYFQTSKLLPALILHGKKHPKDGILHICRQLYTRCVGVKAAKRRFFLKACAGLEENTNRHHESRVIRPVFDQSQYANLQEYWTNRLARYYPANHRPGILLYRPAKYGQPAQPDQLGTKLPWATSPWIH